MSAPPRRFCARFGGLGATLAVAAFVALVALAGHTAVAADAPVPLADQPPTLTARALAFHFTPTERAQIAIWIERPDGTFLRTVALTQAVSYRGIGNRPGAAQMNSGYHWPYGRREGVLPVWGQRRANAPDVPGQFPRVIFQNRPEGYASRTCEDSTGDDYFCLAFSGNSQKDGLDAVSCATRFNSDKGRIITPQDVAAGYWEPADIGGMSAMRRLGLTSLYPPRRDVVTCAFDADPVCRSGTVRHCLDNPDAARFASAARQAMPDIDAVTTATPPGDVEQTVLFSVPDTWADGDYVAWLEINTEGDYNDQFNALTYPTPKSGQWDSWAMTYGYSFRGQPSVVYSVPFVLGASMRASTAVAAGYGSVDGTEANAGEMHAMDGAISADPGVSPGSGADRLRFDPTSVYRLEVEVRDRDFCLDGSPPGETTDFVVEPIANSKHSHQWGTLRFTVPGSAFPIAAYEVRLSTQPIYPGDETSFIQGQPASAAVINSEALMVPVGAPQGTTVTVDFGGMVPLTHYWVGIRALDACRRPGPHVVAELSTTKVDYTQLKGCFIATAAWGSALEPHVAALRKVRDRLVPASGLFAIATDLYYRSGPAAADVLRRSELARAVVRQVLGPIGVAAEAVEDLRQIASGAPRQAQP